MKAVVTYTDGKKAELPVKSFHEYAAWLERHWGEWKEAHCDQQRPKGKNVYDQEEQNERKMDTA